MRVSRTVSVTTLLTSLMLLSGGCFGGESTSSESSSTEGNAPKKTAEQPVRADQADEQKQKPAPKGRPKPKPGWSASLSGGVAGEVEGSLVLQKYTHSVSTIELAASLHDSGEPTRRMAMGIAKVGAGETGTYPAKYVEAVFEPLNTSCRLPKGETFQVDVTVNTDMLFKGTFDGELECEPLEVDDGEEKEPKTVQITGEFVDS